jgi:hypothetical protein
MMKKRIVHAEPFACHPERSEGSRSAQGKLREAPAVHVATKADPSLRLG